MATQYRCKNLLRLKEVTTKTSLQGIDYLEVGPDQKTLKVYLIRDKYKEDGEEKDRLVPDLKKDNIAILGGVRVRGGTILPGSDGELVVMPGKLQVESVSVMDYVLTVVVNQPGDFSTYTLRLVRSLTDLQPPDKFDVQLCEVEFSFKIACPSEFDCAAKRECPAERLEEPEISYLAKDYASFRRLLLDRLSVIMPDWKERNPADVDIMLVELLAYAGDWLSYWQDSVATEAYLGTARMRTSLRRHARLLDYPMHDGCNARAWVCFLLKENCSLTVSTNDLLLTRGALDRPLVLSKKLIEIFEDIKDPEKCAPDVFMSLKEPDVDPDKLMDILKEKAPAIYESLQKQDTCSADLSGILSVELAELFMPLHNQRLDSARNTMSFHTWSDEQCCLPQGATRATLVCAPGLELKKGDLLLFEEIKSPTTGRPEDLDRNHRQVVRLTSAKKVEDPVTIISPYELYEVTWDEQDALSFPLCLSAIPKDGIEPVEVSVARGNIILADHGYAAMPDEANKIAPVTGKECRYRPKLKRGPLTRQGGVFNKKGELVPFDPAASACSAMHWEMRDVRPAIRVKMNGKDWDPVNDLLNSERFDTYFVVESESDGSAYLRFGDDTFGLKPSPDPEPTAIFRIGNGAAGNVGAESIAQLILAATPPHLNEMIKGSFIENTDIKVWNPLPAAGGTEPESLEQVRQFAPQAFRVQERAVTAADWEDVAERQSGIQKAAARLRWTGSWYTAFVTIDRKDGLPVDPTFKTDMQKALEQYRLAGYDLEFNGPVYVPLEIVIMVCVKRGFFRSNVKQSLLKAFSSFDLPNGQRGFFHPDNFTFGTPLYLAQIYQAAMAVDGVASVKILRFKRWGKADAGELAAEELKPGPFEILRLDNDPNYLENGKIEFNMQAGL